MSDEPDYVGFYTAYLVQFIAMLGNSVSICASVSIFFGMFFYINGMTEDLKVAIVRIAGVGPEKSAHQTDTLWQAYVGQITFHSEVIR